MEQNEPLQGRFLGLPYDLRKPTFSKVKARFWNPEDERLLTPMVFGWGYALNLYRLAHVLRLSYRAVSSNRIADLESNRDQDQDELQETIADQQEIINQQQETIEQLEEERQRAGKERTRAETKQKLHRLEESVEAVSSDASPNPTLPTVKPSIKLN